MQSSLDPQVVSGLIWAALFVLLVSVAVIGVLSARGILIRLHVVVSREKPAVRRVLRGAVFLALMMIVTVFCLVATAKERTGVRLAVLGVCLVVASVAGHLTWTRLQESIRRRSENAAYWECRGLEVGGALNTIETEEELHSYAGENLVSELSLSACAIYRAVEAGFQCVWSHPEGSPWPAWTDSDLLPEVLAQSLTSTAITVANSPSGSPARWHLLSDERIPEEQERLASRDVRAAVSIRRNGGMAGFVLLGAREGSRPFLLPHLLFAEAVAGHLGRSLDAIQRLQRTHESSQEAEREKQEHEALTRVRSFLAPPERPEVPGLEYAWDYWRGDQPSNAFFDTVSLPNRSLGFLMAEAEGTDLEAAIRLVQLQALMRSRFWAYADDLAELLESTERALLASRYERRPLRVFLARFRPVTRTLHYINAGYYAPMMLRVHQKGAEILRFGSRSGALCEGTRTELHEEELLLQPGDILAAMTPGVASTISPQGALWGESRLADTILSWEAQPVQDIARLTLRTVDEFSGKARNAPHRYLMLMRLQAQLPA